MSNKPGTLVSLKLGKAPDNLIKGKEKEKIIILGLGNS